MGTEHNKEADAYEIGLGFSGFNRIPLGQRGNKETVINVSLPQMRDDVREGLATIDIHVFDHGKPLELPAETFPNAMIRAQVDWKSGIGTGTFFVDITRDTVITVGGTNTIRVTAQLVSGDIDPETGLPTPMIAYIEKRLEATVHWKTSANPKPARVTTEAVSILADSTPGPWQRIPLRARDMIANTDTPAGLSTLTAEFAKTDAVGAPVDYAVIDPNANGCPIWHGVEFFRFRNSAAAMRVFGGFDTWS